MSDESETGVVCFRTRREAVWLGIRYFVIVAAIACTVMFCSACAVNWQDAIYISMLPWWRSIAISLVVSLPVVVLMGAISGHEHYRSAAGCPSFWAGPALLFALALSFAVLRHEVFSMICLGIIFFWSSHLGNRSVLQGSRIATGFYCLLVGLCCLICSGLALKKMDGCVGACAYCSLFLGDNLVMCRVREWAAAGLIERRAHQFQFSLGTMLIFCVVLGGYALALATFFPPRRW